MPAKTRQNPKTGRRRCVPLGPREVADFLERPRPTVQQWMFRKRLPEPDFIVSGQPAWEMDTIVEWAVATGRIDAEQGEKLAERWLDDQEVRQQQADAV